MTDLRRLAYLSTASDGVDRKALEALCTASRRNNLRDGITGILLHVDGSFLQVVEGPPAAISGLLARLEGDARHRGIVILEDVRTRERLFPGWAMQGRGATYAHLAHLAPTSESFSDLVQRLWATDEAQFLVIFLRTFFTAPWERAALRA